VLNAQVSLRAPCCKKWFDCKQCHNESEGHELGKDGACYEKLFFLLFFSFFFTLFSKVTQWELIFGCKKCKHVFKKDMREFDHETDGYCPKCDNEYFIDAKTPNQEGYYAISVQGGTDVFIILFQDIRFLLFFLLFYLKTPFSFQNPTWCGTIARSRDISPELTSATL
jgi:uncharacterized CHY-type Zn-finger protein